MKGIRLKVYVCDECEYDVERKYYMKVHKHWKHGRLKNNCEVCGKKFQCKKNRKNFFIDSKDVFLFSILLQKSPRLVWSIAWLNTLSKELEKGECQHKILIFYLTISRLTPNLWSCLKKRKLSLNP